MINLFLHYKKKGQGALEYLLLIGGGVLISVIVVALLLSMGTSSREIAKDNADSSQRMTDVPQPVNLISVDANNCVRGTLFPPNGTALITIAWQPLGEGGTHELVLTDFTNQKLVLSDGVQQGTEFILNPNNLAAQSIEVGPVTGVTGRGVGNCGDSYKIIVNTTKNNQTVRSNSVIFNFN